MRYIFVYSTLNFQNSSQWSVEKLVPRSDLRKKNQSKIIMFYRIDIWYIYLHLVDIYGKLDGKYTIHGSYGCLLLYRISGEKKSRPKK